MADRNLSERDQGIIDYEIPKVIEAAMIEWVNECEDQDLADRVHDVMNEMLELFEKRFN